MKKTLIISMVIGLIAIMALASGVMATDNNDGCTTVPGAVFEEGIGNGGEATRHAMCNVAPIPPDPVERPGITWEYALPVTNGS